MLASLAAAAASAGLHLPPRPIASPPPASAPETQTTVDAQQHVLADPYTSSFPPPSTFNLPPKLPKEAISVGLDSNRLGRCACHCRIQNRFALCFCGLLLLTRDQICKVFDQEHTDCRGSRASTATAAAAAAASAHACSVLLPHCNRPLRCVSLTPLSRIHPHLPPPLTPAADASLVMDSWPHALPPHSLHPTSPPRQHTFSHAQAAAEVRLLRQP
jgi:hypothetical protein